MCGERGQAGGGSDATSHRCHPTPTRQASTRAGTSQQAMQLQLIRERQPLGRDTFTTSQPPLPIAARGQAGQQRPRPPSGQTIPPQRFPGCSTWSSERRDGRKTARCRPARTPRSVRSAPGGLNRSHYLLHRSRGSNFIENAARRSRSPEHQRARSPFGSPCATSHLLSGPARPSRHQLRCPASGGPAMARGGRDHRAVPRGSL